MNGWKTCSRSQGNDYYRNQQFTASLITAENLELLLCSANRGALSRIVLQFTKSKNCAIRSSLLLSLREGSHKKNVIEKITKISYKKRVFFLLIRSLSVEKA